MKPKILILGATGNVGGEAAHLLSQNGAVEVIAGVRSPEKAQHLENMGIEVRKLDLDRVETLSSALEGIDRALLITGYTVDMLKQSKRFLDAAKLMGVQHIVHVGASGAPTNEVAHWGWHQFVESYIEKEEFSWTHLRPEGYIQNITTPGFGWLNEDTITNFIGDALWSWVDARDVAAVAVEALLAPQRYHGQIIPLGYDAMTVSEVAKVLSEISGKNIQANHMPPEAFRDGAISAGADPAYIECVYIQFTLDAAGKIPGAGQIFDNFEKIVGRPPKRWHDVAQELYH